MASCAIASAQWVVETNSFRIREPANVEGEYDSAIGDFGVPLYGGALTGEIVYMENNKLGCNVFSKPLVPVTLPVFLLVDRGDCYFVEKAYNAEKAGAKAIIVADYKDERLLTMAVPEDRPEIAALKNDITIPTALITEEVGQKIKDALHAQNAAPVVVELDWKESVLHEDDRVEWDFWTSSNDGCGNACDRQSEFKIAMRETAQSLEKDKYALFTPHFMVRKCSYNADSTECTTNCINNGRYCAVDSIDDAFSHKFQGWQVVEENKRQLCVHSLLSDKKEAWKWWDYAAGFAAECTMADGRFADRSCIRAQLEKAGLEEAAVDTCMGDSTADATHDLLQGDYVLQGNDQWGNGKILLLPTVIVNKHQYRGRLDVPSILRALCAGFSETTEPEVCLAGSMQEDDCAAETHSCWVHTEGKQSFSACKDTFRGYVCQCPEGWRGDGFKCEDIDECAEGTAQCQHTCSNIPGGYECSCRDGFQLLGGHTSTGICLPINQCKENKGGCEYGCDTDDGKAVCSCPTGLRLGEDGKRCIDIDECAEGTAQCDQECVNQDPRETGRQYVCKCRSGYSIDIDNQHKCITKDVYMAKLGLKNSKVGAWTIAGIVAMATVLAVAAGYAVHRLRMRNVMQNEIRDIMRQYMPLEGNNVGEGLLEESPRIKAAKIPVVSHADEPGV
ncbi:g11610 [Coccomyxa viridis]|uniref:G11610 protein n=1 Tax=Coccomyxa viridis TaxID=1274662 RepID=A0ABP1G8G0_9CHLO